jgi:hypothetical protein
VEGREDKGAALLERQCPQRGSDSSALFTGDRRVGGTPPIVGADQVCDVRWRSWVRTVQAEGVDGQVAGDREEPGRHRAPTRIVRLGVPPGPRQRFLGDILGQSGVADHAERQAVDATLEPADEGGGGATVACAETSQQGLVGWAVGTAGAEIHR